MPGNGAPHIRHGIGAVRPYLYGYLDLTNFVETVFGAEIIEDLADGHGHHVEARIGDSVVVLETGAASPPSAKPASVYVYVPDVDITYRRALDAGAASVAVPEDKPYGERGAGIQDTFGNTWWIATYTGS